MVSVFDPTQLASLVAVAETGGFTRAAERLAISQPTVSQHIARLERRAGRQLVIRDTRGVALTDAGAAMVGFARTILAANGAAADYFDAAASRGRVRFGAADDFAATQVPEVLRRFRWLHPGVSVELTVNLSHVLYRKLRGGQLDLIFIKQFPDRPEPRIPEQGAVAGTDSFAWVAHPDIVWDPAEPVPLVVYPASTHSRVRAIEALDRAGRAWRISCTAREVNGLIAATRAGLGVAPYPRSLMPADLIRVDQSFDLPAIGSMEFTLLTNPLAPAGPTQALRDAIMRHGAQAR